eukprot:1806138-Prymnesium_polylepis.2
MATGWPDRDRRCVSCVGGCMMFWWRERCASESSMQYNMDGSGREGETWTVRDERERDRWRQV